MKKRSVALVLFSMVAACVLLGSWLKTQESCRDNKDRLVMRYVQTDTLWKKIDHAAFFALNGTMKDHRAMQWLWGVGNHRLFDLVSASWMVLLFVVYYIRNPRNEDRTALLQFGLYMGITLFLAGALSELLVPFRRWSPGATDAVMRQAVILSEPQYRIPWEVKTGSTTSFPGDHAMVLLIIGSYIICRLRSWYGWAAGAGIVIFILPRLAAGGHWLSDVLAGSMSFYLVLFPLFMLVPVRERVQAWLYVPAAWLRRLLQFLERGPERELAPQLEEG